VDAAHILEKYTNDEFEFESTAFKNLNTSSMKNQNLIVLNDLRGYSSSL